MYKVIMISPGGTKRDLRGGFDSANAAEDFARENNHEYCDENGFVWRLDVVDYDSETAALMIPRREWAETFLEFRQNGDDQALLYLCDVMENAFTRYYRLKFKAIRNLVDALIPLNRLVSLMEFGEIPTNIAIEDAYSNLMNVLTELAENSQDIV